MILSWKTGRFKSGTLIVQTSSPDFQTYGVVLGYEEGKISWNLKVLWSDGTVSTLDSWLESHYSVVPVS